MRSEPIEAAGAARIAIASIDVAEAASRERVVFTLATGKPSYFSMAINLARSIELWNKGKGLEFFIVTDLDVELPKDLRITRVVRVPPGRLPKGFSAKLQLDQFDLARKCLFIDADCLVMGDLDPIFRAFEGRPVGIFGEMLTSGEWFGDVAATCGKLQIPWRPIFNGGVYYFERGSEARAVYSFARALEPSYDAVGFVRLRSQPNEEALVGAALAKRGIMPVQNDGRYYADFQWWPVLKRISIAAGECRMCNPPKGDQNHQSRYPAGNAVPLIVHFLGYHIGSIVYRRCALELRLRANRFPASAFIARCAFVPADFVETVKAVLRPFYRLVFGSRPVRRDVYRFHG